MTNPAAPSPEFIPPALIEYILLGSGDSRRHMQDSPILGDVWLEYAKHPDAPADLLITVHRDASAGELARQLYAGVHDRPQWRGDSDDPDIAPLQGFVAARLYFDDLLSVVVPRTKWWKDERTAAEFATFEGDPTDVEGPLKLNKAVTDVRALLAQWSETASDRLKPNQRTSVERFVALCTLVFVAREHYRTAAANVTAGAVEGATLKEQADAAREVADQTKAALQETTNDEIWRTLDEVLDVMRTPNGQSPTVFQVSLNRSAAPALDKSVATTKADAARRVFDLDCRGINWAIVDSGIDGDHPAFYPGQVKATYDFTTFRYVVSLGNVKKAVRERNLARIAGARQCALGDDADAKLERLAKDAVAGRPVQWDLAHDFIEVPKPQAPDSPHGTHVAGIIGAHREPEKGDSVDGMCPGIGLFDFRILGSDERDTEFAVIGALQFIRYLNEQAGAKLIKGVNMSLSIRHDVRNYACGGTPVCVESERLVDSGVVVVVAAGNLGFQHTMLGGQWFDNYAAFSITDPGNADRVITVGSTHRHEPFTYGVSYFSSRGPTGDGRLKPDLVAPGERIYGPLPGERWDTLDGTSMAAPHVSGASAMLMTRYPELVGKPLRIKQILCDTASDLGRERNFQGHGLVDVLRALQSQ